MTLVVDASAVAEFLLGTSRGIVVGSEFAGHQLIAPQHLSVEVLSIVRVWSLGGHLSGERALAALADLEELRVDQVDVAGQLCAAFALRHNFSGYDAMYVVLARALGCQLLTLDARLAAAAPDCAYVPTCTG